MNIHEKITAAEQCRSDYVRRDFEAGKAAATALSKALNGGSREPIMLGFLEGLMREHRFLQSETVWTVLTALAELGAVQRTDARNEHAVKACKDMREALSDRLPLL